MNSMHTHSSPLSPTEARRWTRLGVLSALCLLLGYLETFVPIPIPGVKLGLANIPILVALANADLRGACWIALIKVLVTGLLFGNPVTIAYSAAGTAIALALMCPLSLLPTMRLEMVSVVGALAHEAGQLLVAQWLLGTPLVWYSAPLLAVAGCATGLLCGIVAQRTAKLLRDAEQDDAPAQKAEPHVDVAAGRLADSAHEEKGSLSAQALAKAVAYIAFVVVAMHADELPLLGACLVVALAAAAVTRTAPTTLARSLLPVLPIVLVTLVAQIASAQQGTVVATLGPITITREALTAAARMTLRLASITVTSVALVAAVDRQELARMVRTLCRPLELLGCDLRGPELSLTTTVQLLPSLVTNLGDQLQPNELLSKAFWTTWLPAHVRELYQQALKNT